MTWSFDSEQGLIVVGAELEGPSGIAILRLALDTGATGTMINAAMLASIGCDPTILNDRVQVTTGSGVEFVPRFTLNRIKALGQERSEFSVLSHTLPPSASVDGLLGLDFLRGLVLTVDLRQGEITLS